MGFTIAVTTPPHAGNAYLPGQKIGGRVTFVAEKDEQRIDDVQITFQAKTSSQVTVRRGEHSTTYRERIVLFKYVSQLSGERQVFNRSQRAEWPFEFICPATTEYTRKSTTASAAFAPDGICPLPPSIEFVRSGWGGKKGRCYVRYKFKVVGNSERLLHKHKVVNYLSYTIGAPNPWPAPHTLQYHLSDQRWQSRSMRTEKHTFKQKIQHVFTDNPELKNPTVAFGAFIIMPPALTYGQTAPVYLILQHQIKAPTDPKNPTLVLKTLSLAMQSRTSLRVKSSSWSSTYEDDGKETCEWRRYTPDPSPRLPLDGTPFTIDQNLSLGAGPASAAVFQPDFKTYNIARSHAVKILITIMHVESGHMFSFDQKIAITILPACYAPQGSIPAPAPQLLLNSSAPSANPESSHAESSNAAPPPYEDHSELPSDKSERLHA